MICRGKHPKHGTALADQVPGPDLLEEGLVCQFMGLKTAAGRQYNGATGYLEHFGGVLGRLAVLVPGHRKVGTLMVKAFHLIRIPQEAEPVQELLQYLNDAAPQEQSPQLFRLDEKGKVVKVQHPIQGTEGGTAPAARAQGSPSALATGRALASSSSSSSWEQAAGCQFPRLQGAARVGLMQEGPTP